MEAILCPTDFSPAAENAIRYAQQIALVLKARIVLFHNIFEPVSPEYIYKSAKPNLDLEYRQVQQHKLEALKESLQMANTPLSIDYDTKIEYGLLKNTIRQVALQMQAGLVVMSQARAEGWKKILAGAALKDVIKSAPCPLLIIPPQTTFREIHTIVFATDPEGEPFPEVSFLTKLAGRFGAKILILHILTRDEPQTRQRALAGLDQLQKHLAYPNADICLETNPHIDEGISQFCRRQHADLLVMGYHSRRFWQQLLIQDHTRQMAYHANLPLLISHFRQ